MTITEVLKTAISADLVERALLNSTTRKALRKKGILVGNRKMLIKTKKEKEVSRALSIAHERAELVGGRSVPMWELTGHNNQAVLDRERRLVEKLKGKYPEIYKMRMKVRGNYRKLFKHDQQGMAEELTGLLKYFHKRSEFKEYYKDLIEELGKNI